MLGIGCPDRHPLLRVTSPKTYRPQRAPLPRERVRSMALLRHWWMRRRGSLNQLQFRVGALEIGDDLLRIV
jgi:hypothetical protein